MSSSWTMQPAAAAAPARIQEASSCTPCRKRNELTMEGCNSVRRILQPQRPASELLLTKLSRFRRRRCTSFPQRRFLLFLLLTSSHTNISSNSNSSSSWLARIVLPTTAFLFVGAAPFDFCSEQLVRADANGDGLLSSEDEFGTAVAYLSGNNLSPTAALQTSELVAVYTATQSSPLSVNSVTSENYAVAEALILFCSSLYKQILAALSSTIDTSESRCLFAMSIGDANRDSQLVQSVEFPRYANQVSGNRYGFSAAYETLPPKVQRVFGEFADDSATATIDISGAKATEELSEEQGAFLLQLCRVTAIAVLASDGDETVTDAPVATPVATTTATAPVVAAAAPVAAVAPAAVPVAVPVAAPVAPPVAATGGGEALPEGFVPSFTYAICTRMIAFSDLTRDNALNSDEYYRLCNRLTSDAWADNGSFEQLPSVLQTTFARLLSEHGNADNLDVFGSKPGQSPTDEQAAVLANLCTQTDVAIQQALNEPEVETSVAPTVAAGTSPVAAEAPVAAPVAAGVTIPFSKCKTDMIIADSSRDGKLNEKEYVRFVSRNDDSVEMTDEFSTLTPSLQDNFGALTGDDGEIDVTGSKPNQSPTPEQEEHLLNICASTAEALAADDAAAVPTMAPMGLGSSSAPVSNNETTATMAPTGLISGNVTVYNAFTISNTERLRAVAFQNGTERKGLDDAYALFVRKSVIAFKGGDPELAQPTAEPATPTDPSSTNATTEELPAARRYLRGSPKAVRVQQQLQQKPQQRELDVTDVVRNSANIYLLRDAICPSYIRGNDYCQTVFASFNIEFENEQSQEALVEQLTNFTQDRVIPLLSESLLTLTPNTTIKIAGEFWPVQPRDADFIVEPIDDGAVTSGVSVGQIVGGTVFLLVVLGGAGWFWYSRRTKKVGKSSEGSTTNDKADLGFSDNGGDNAAMYGYGVESAPSPGKSKRGGDAFQMGGEDSESDDAEEDKEDESSVGFSVQQEALENSESGDAQEKTGGKRFGAFSMGKKKTSVSDNIAILDTPDDFQNGGDDFGNYAFEEPTELQEPALNATDPFGVGASETAWTPQDPDGDAWGTSDWAATASAHNRDSNADDGFGALGAAASDDDGDDDYSLGSFTESQSSGSHSKDPSLAGSSIGKNSVISNGDGNIGKLGGLVDNGKWDNVMRTASRIENNLNESSSNNLSLDKSVTEDKSESDSSFNQEGKGVEEEQKAFMDDPFDDRTAASAGTVTSQELKRRAEFRSQVEDLVRKAVPDEIDNIDNMMNQFAGREAELISTLQTMYERSTSQRRLKAVHKSKGIRDRDARGFAAGGAEGSAVIAAASMLNAEANPVEFDDDTGGSEFDEDASYYDEDDPDASYTGSHSGSRSYADDDPSYTGSHSGSGSRSRSYRDDDPSYTGSYSGSGSRSRSYRDDDPSYTGSHSGSGSRSRSYRDDDPSYTGSHSGSQGSRSYRDDDPSYTGSHSGSQERSRTGSHSGSYDDQDRSFTGSHSGSYDAGSFTGSYSQSGSYSQEGSLPEEGR